MTNELEKQFFDTFGIEPREFKSCDVGTFCPYPEKECGTDTCPYYRTYKVDYPAISDRILLELICISKQRTMLSDFFMYRPSIEELKNNILENMLNKDLFNFKNKDIKHEVQALFEEKNNESR